MMLDTKTILTNQAIEQDRQKLLAQLLAERYGMPTRPENEVKTD